jgi:hypothetical protein
MPHCLDNRLTHDGEDVCLRSRPPSTPHTHFLAPGQKVQLEGLGKLKKLNDLIGTRTLDLPAYSIVSQPTLLPRAPFEVHSIRFVKRYLL